MFPNYVIWLSVIPLLWETGRISFQWTSSILFSTKYLNRYLSPQLPIFQFEDSYVIYFVWKLFQISSHSCMLLFCSAAAFSNVTFERNNTVF